MSKLLILMVGLHKTGTSSIQNTCAASRRELYASGFSYPVYESPSGLRANHSDVLKVAFRHSFRKFGLVGQFDNRSRDALMAKERDRVRGQLEAILVNTQGTLVLAAESISLYGEEELREMRDWFIQRGRELRVMCHVRHLSSWIHSMIAQRVTGYMRVTIGAAVDEFVELGGLVRPRIERIRAALPEAEFHSHERAVAHPNGPPGYFLHNIGVPLQGINFQRANEGASDPAVRMLSIINERFVRFSADSPPRPNFLAKETWPTRNFPGPRFQLRKDEANPLLSTIESERRWLAENLGPEFAGPPMQWNHPPAPISIEAAQPALEALPPEVNEWLLANRSRWQ